jgi:predicted transposase/invertase (TIGR01784 family)
MMSNSKHQNHKHDNFVSNAIRTPEVAKSLLENHLRPEILAEIDTNHIEFDDTVLTSKKLDKRLTDVLMKVKMKDGSDGYIYAGVEHQSSNDKFMPLRILEYNCMIWRQYIKVNPDAKKLPMICYIILSNSKEKEDMPHSMAQLFEQPEIAIKCLLNPILVNLTKMTDEELPEDPWLRLLETSLKYRRDLDLIGILEKLAEIIKVICKKPNGTDYITSFLCYNESNVSEKDEEKARDLIKNILGKKGKKIMGIMGKAFAQEWYSRGEARGEARGALKNAKQTAKRMLSRGMDVSVIAEITHLSLAELEKIKNPRKAQKIEIVLV